MKPLVRRERADLDVQEASITTFRMLPGMPSHSSTHWSKLIVTFGASLGRDRRDMRVN